jgi:hypothetical protein
LTEPAVSAIRDLTSGPGLTGQCGLRIAHQDTAGSLELSIVPGPDAGDEIVETDGIRVFLHTDVAAMFNRSNRTLSAKIADDGVVFLID